MKLLESLVLLPLRQGTKWQLAKNNPTIVGVTGSAGKSSTVSAIARVLETKYRTKETHKGNSQTGIPFELLDIPVEGYKGAEWLYVLLLAAWRVLTSWPKYDVFVAEMAIDSDKSPSNMGFLLSLFQPSIGVFLNVNSVHSQNFSNPDALTAISEEKGKLLMGLPEDGLAIYSADHPTITALTPSIKATKKTYSVKDAGADVVLKSHSINAGGTTFEFTKDSDEYSLNFASFYMFREAFGSFAAALLIGEWLDIPINKGITALENNYELPPGRMSLIEGINNSTIIDSSYNSSTEPTIATLKLFGTIPTNGKRIAVLGDMREIGNLEEEAHMAVAEEASKSSNTIVLIGPLMKKYAYDYLIEKGFGQRLHWFANAYEAISTTASLIEDEDLILVKGSQNTIFLEIIVKAIMAHPEQAEELLCRQSPAWEKERQKMLK
jgi:UDP-N-acetylmuramoyl-tripeptide--D-alanyl-D-alanine ligase